MTWEDKAAAVLRERLHEVGAPPSRLTVDELVHAGERRRIVVTTAAGVAALAGLVAVPAAIVVTRPAPQDAVDTGRSGCTETRLPLPTGASPEVGVASVSADGRYIVGRPNQRTTEPPAWLWRDGKVLELDGVDLKEIMYIQVNSSGVLAVSHGTGLDNSRAALYRDGQQRPLPAPAGVTKVTTRTINDHGDVLGSGSRGDRSVLVLWPAGNPDVPRVMEPPPNLPAVVAVGFTPDRRIVAGIGLNDAGTMRPYVFDLDGTAQALPLPDGVHPAGVGGVNGNLVYGRVSVTGASTSAPEDGFRAIRWDLRTGSPTLLGDPRITAFNGTGWSVRMELPDFRPVRVSPDGRAEELPLPSGPVRWISPDGRSLLTEAPVARWHCA